MGKEGGGGLGGWRVGKDRQGGWRVGKEGGGGQGGWGWARRVEGGQG